MAMNVTTERCLTSTSLRLEHHRRSTTLTRPPQRITTALQLHSSPIKRLRRTATLPFRPSPIGLFRHPATPLFRPPPSTSSDFETPRVLSA
jgi:hypothetical protein